MPGNQRVVAVDVARGIALIGMLASHFTPETSFSLSEPWTWILIAEGRAACLFVFVAGVSLALSSGGTQLVSGGALAAARVRILVRAVIIFVIGGILVWLQTPVSVILEYYALYFILSLPVLAWSRRALIALAAAMIIVGTVLVTLLPWVAPQLLGDPFTRLLAQGSYPALTWVPLLLVGIVVGRSAFTRLRSAWTLLAVGAALVIIGFAAKRLFSTMLSPDAGAAPTNPLPSGEGFALIGDAAVTALLSGSRSTSPLVIIANIGVVSAVLGACVLATRWIRLIVEPFARTGRLALTLYVAHIVAIAFVMHTDLYRSGMLLFPALFAAIILATLYFQWRRQGPLETVLRRAVKRMQPSSASSYAPL